MLFPLPNADEVDTDMLQRLQAAIDGCDLQTINMNKDGEHQRTGNEPGALCAPSMHFSVLGHKVARASFMFDGVC